MEFVGGVFVVFLVAIPLIVTTNATVICYTYLAARRVVLQSEHKDRDTHREWELNCGLSENSGVLKGRCYLLY